MVFGGPGFTSGFIVGFGTGFISRELVQIGASIAKPVTRAVVKAGITAFEKGRESLAQVGETFEDLVAEVRAGMARAPQAAEATGAAVTTTERQEGKPASQAGSASSTDEQKKKKGSSK